MKEFTWPTEVRFRDCDGLGHVNNAVYHSYIESARTHWLDDVLQLGVFTEGRSIPIILAHTSIDYIQQIKLSDKVEIVCWLSSIGNKSFRQVYEIRTKLGVAAKAEAVIVWFDFDKQKSCSIPETAKDSMLPYLRSTN
ncbi:MAG: acyl-CoA thioesterase [Pseudobacteriovorax sp.]|nr:acyl-CoA thioesterase [Pseudobacteriovorax sp.]